MAPDINSLPPSRRDTSSPNQIRAMNSNVPVRRDNSSPRSSMSLAAAATVNAAERCSPLGSPRLGRNPSERRRSQVALHLNLNDPIIPSPGETPTTHRTSISQSSTGTSPVTTSGLRYATADPHHRTPSLGEIHNELEQEQEAQVNRMLQLIRDQQLQLDALRSGQSGRNHSRQPSQTQPTLPRQDSNAIDEDETPPLFERTISFPSPHPALPQPHRRSSLRHRTPSGSPALHPREPLEPYPPSPLEGRSLRDETAYYQAETANLTRENQMLRHRVRELEKQLQDASRMPENTPATPSSLGRGPFGREEMEEGEASQAARIENMNLS